jgi:hypothetical protein
MRQRPNLSQTFQPVQDAGLWIASLRAPSPALVRALLARVPALSADPTATYAGQFSPSRAFCLLAERVPAAAEVLREGASSPDPAVRAVALAARHGELTAGRVTFDAVSESIAAGLAGELGEVLVALAVLNAHPPADRAAWSPRILAAVEGMQGALFPGSNVVASGFCALAKLHQGAELPTDVRAAAERFLTKVVPQHVAAGPARALLAGA